MLYCVSGLFDKKVNFMIENLDMLNLDMLIGKTISDVTYIIEDVAHMRINLLTTNDEIFSIDAYGGEDVFIFVSRYVNLNEGV